jgi:transposase
VDIGKIRRVGRGRPRLRPSHVASDKAYDSDKLRAALRERGIVPVIPSRRNYRGRNVIERCFNRLKHWRRLATRYEKLGVNYVAVLLVVSSMHFLNLLI